MKRRAVGVTQTLEHGEWEPIAFLLAWWIDGSHCRDKRAHVRRIPTMGQVSEAYEQLRLHFGVGGE